MQRAPFKIVPSEHDRARALVGRTREPMLYAKKSFAESLVLPGQSSFRDLLARCVVAFAGADLKVFFESRDFDRTIAAIGIEVGGAIRHDILAAQLVFNRRKRIFDIFHLVGEEGAASG